MAVGDGREPRHEWTGQSGGPARTAGGQTDTRRAAIRSHWTARGPRESDVDEQANVRVVEGLFSSLERGDIRGVLDRLSEDVEWRIAAPSELPYVGIHHGRDEVARFFQSFGQAAEFEFFEPQEYLAKGNKVVVLGRERQRIKDSGQVVDTDWAMVFALRDGCITRFRNYVDSHTVGTAGDG